MLPSSGQTPTHHDYLRNLGAVPVAYGDGLTDRVRQVAAKVTAALDGAGRLTRLTQLHERGLLTAEIHRTFPLEQAAEAHRVIDTGHVRGKLALTV